MTAVECLAALAGAVLGWKAGGLLNELRSLKRPAAPTTALLAFPAAAHDPARQRHRSGRPLARRTLAASTRSATCAHGWSTERRSGWRMRMRTGVS